ADTMSIFTPSPRPSPSRPGESPRTVLISLMVAGSFIPSSTDASTSPSRIISSLLILARVPVPSIIRIIPDCRIMSGLKEAAFSRDRSGAFSVGLTIEELCSVTAVRGSPHTIAKQEPQDESNEGENNNRFHGGGEPVRVLYHRCINHMTK